MTLIISDYKLSDKTGPSLKQKIDAVYDSLLAAWNGLRLKLAETGVDNAMTMIPPPDQAFFRLEVDPFDKSETIIAVWQNKQNEKLGEIQVRNNKTFYAEFDVIRSHPTDVRWFVEAVTAWGRKDDIKSELRLLPAI